MGSGNFNVAAYKKQASKAKESKNSGFAAVSMCEEFNPKKVDMRFSKRGPFNEFRDVITVLIGLDVTGSMDIIPKSLLEGRLGSLMVDLKKTFNRPNENLQISFAGMGDAKTDQAPLQVTHFESDNRFAQQLQNIWLEKGGGGNGAESYHLLWYYAANKTHLNYVEQDKRKGILITIGDDNVHPELTAKEIQKYLDPKYDGGNITNQVLVNAAREQYEVYHIVITDGHSYNYDYLKSGNKTEEQKKAEAKQWTDLLGLNNVIHSKSDKVADAIAEIVKRHRPLISAEMTNLTEQDWSKQNKENLTDKQWEEVLSYTLCPLSGKFMHQPVELGGGKRAYEKQAIEDYVREHKSDPITHEKLNTSALVFKPNLNIAQLCANYKPFFDALPENRRNNLVQSALSQIQIERQKAADLNKNPHAFFAKNTNVEHEQAMKNFENLQLSLTCSITGEIMQDPVILVATGQTYERKAIEQWLEKSNIDPNTKIELKDKTLVTNFALKGLCDQARAQPKPNI